MEFKSLFIVPIIGFGYFDEIINTKDNKWFIRTVIILCFKIDWCKRLE
jgi:Na+/glutamate symporter